MHTHTHTRAIYLFTSLQNVQLDENYNQLMQYGLLFINMSNDKFCCNNSHMIKNRYML